MERKKYEEYGNEYFVDSALTDDVVDIVKNEILCFYQENQEVIFKYFFKLISHNQKISQGFLTYLVTKYLQSQSRSVTNQFKEQVIEGLTHKLLEESSNLLLSIKHGSAVVISKVASTWHREHIAVIECKLDHVFCPKLRMPHAFQRPSGNH